MRIKRGLGLVATLVALTCPFASTAQETGTTRTGDLIVGTKVVKPFAFKDAEGRWTGISIDLWEEIARRRGYEYDNCYYYYYCSSSSFSSSCYYYYYCCCSSS